MLTHKTKMKSIALYSVIMALGLLLAIFVFSSTSKVERTTITLVEEQIPSLALVQQVINLLSEQERLLYEYYAKDENPIYIRLHQEKLRQLHESMNQLSTLPAAMGVVAFINQQINKIESTALSLRDNLYAKQTDWQLAREQLSEITQTREATIPKLIEIENGLQQKVDLGYHDTTSLLAQTLWIVSVFSMMIIVITLIVGRYVTGYLKESAKSARLALFPTRNPNAIISLNEHEDVIFGNPAADKLLKTINAAKGKYHDLLPDDFHAISQQLINGQSSMLKVEHYLHQMVFSYEFHWLSDIRQIDLHIIDITEQKKAQNKLIYQAFHNNLTGLFNRNQLIKHLDERITKQPQYPFCLMLIGVRNFSKFVTKHGINNADALQQSIAIQLESAFTHTQLTYQSHLYQLDQSTFVSIVNNANSNEDIDQLYQIVESYVEQPLETQCGGISIELDYGVVNYPNNAKNSEELLKFAHTALESASNIAHSSLIFYSEQLGLKIARQNHLIDSLSHAIKNDQISLHFQPQQNINSESIVGVECLCRWQLDGDNIRPDEFIALAELSGLIIPLGDWILNTACKQAAAWHQSGIHVITAVNISPRQFSQSDFVSKVEHALQTTKLPPELLELEITEGTLMDNETDIINTLHRLKSLGLGLSIDDFGTGYSSLSYLKQFPVDKLKIDQSFIRNCHQSHEDKAIVKTIVDLAKNLGLQLIAEGVENETHFSFLKHVGCDEIQGYFFSKPLPLNQFDDFYCNHTKKCKELNMH